MKKFLFILVGLLFVLNSFGQNDPKVKYKKGNITVDGEVFLTVEKSKGIYGHSFFNLAGEKLFFLKNESYTDRTKVSSSNPNGTVSYSSVFQEGNNDVICEYGFGLKHFAKLLMEFDVLDENQHIVQENLDKMAAIVGFEYTEQMYAPK